MSINLSNFLKGEGYSSVKLIFLKTKHYLIKAKVNGTKGRFILDTGSSNSCICTSLENKFKVISKESEEKASSANSEMINTKISKNNTIQIGKWEGTINLLTFDMNHINHVLDIKKNDTVDGIIGADVFKKSKAILDYSSKKIYLKL